MKLKKVMSLIIAGSLATFALAGCSQTGSSSNSSVSGSSSSTGSSNLSGTVATDGSTSMEQVIGALGEAFQNANSNVKVTYNPTGSGSGITAVQEGRCDIGLSSRALTADEKASGLVETDVCLDGIAIVVNNSSAVKDLTLDQITKIYNGTITNWKDVGGSDATIVLIGREAGSGTRDGFESITGTKDKIKYSQELTSTGDVISTVASNPNAIGYASLSAVGNTVKAVSVGGVAPTEATVQDGSYVIQRPFVFVTKDGTKLSEVAQAFFDWVTSGDVATIIGNAGAVPLKK